MQACFFFFLLICFVKFSFFSLSFYFLCYETQREEKTYVKVSFPLSLYACVYPPNTQTVWVACRRSLGSAQHGHLPQNPILDSYIMKSKTVSVVGNVLPPPPPPLPHLLRNWKLPRSSCKCPWILISKLAYSFYANSFNIMQLSPMSFKTLTWFPILSPIFGCLRFSYTQCKKNYLLKHDSTDFPKR